MKMRGFTLVELMVVVAIIGLISSIAYPAYLDYIVNSRRAVAAACLSEIAQFMERNNTSNMTYSVALPNNQCRADLTAFYTISFPNGEPTASTFIVQAVPQGQQATRDTRCGTLTLNHIGVKTESGTASSYRDCWQ